MINLTSIVPRNKGAFTPAEAMAGSIYQTLAQRIRLVLKNPAVAQYQIDYKNEGIFPRTCIEYEADWMHKRVSKWIEGPIAILDWHKYELFEGSRRGILYHPDTGWVKAVKDGKYKGKVHWIAWDFYKNGGFGRETTSDREEAEETFLHAWKDGGLFKGFKEEQVRALISKQLKCDRGVNGLRSISLFSSKTDGPLFIGGGINFLDFDRTHENIGYLLVEGPKAADEEIVNAEEIARRYELTRLGNDNRSCVPF